MIESVELIQNESFSSNEGIFWSVFKIQIFCESYFTTDYTISEKKNLMRRLKFTKSINFSRIQFSSSTV